MVVLLAGCGRLTMPIAESSSLSLVVDGDPGFISFGGFRWEVSLRTVAGLDIRTWTPDETVAIGVVPGDYELAITFVPMSDAMVCSVTDPNPVPDSKNCTRDEGIPQEVCAIPITIEPFSKIVLRYTVADDGTCHPAL